jgi:hypothetical protein
MNILLKQRSIKMKFNKAILTGILTVVTVPSISEAVPRKYNDCSVEIKKPDNSTEYFMSRDCKTVYVAPPVFGALSVPDYDEQYGLESECRTIANLKEEVAVDQDSALINAEMRRDIMEDIAEKQAMIDDGFLPVGKTKVDVMREIIELRQLANEMKRADDETFKINYDRLGKFAQQHGGTGAFVVENRYNELVSEFERLNKNKGLSFERLPLDQSYLNMKDVVNDSAEDNALEHNAVLEVYDNGVGQLPILSALGEFLKGDEGVEYKVPESGNIFGDAAGGTIRFSKLGACGVREAIGNKSSFSMSDVKAHIRPTATYEYQVQVTRNYQVTYNLAEFWRRYTEQKKSGGFFSRKTMHKMVEDRDSEGWIRFESGSEDQRFEYTDEDIQEIKKEFIDRAIRDIVALKTGDPKGYLALLDPSGKTGAQVIGEELGKCFHLYCKIGAAGFKILDAIFGSTTAASEMISTFDFERTETEVSDRMVRQYGGMTFL